MGLPIDAKTDWQAVCNAEALLCSPKALRNAFRFIVSVLGENGINAPKVTLPPLNTKCGNGWSRNRSRRSSPQFISAVCAGTKQPSDRTIADICRVYNVNEDWLRYGTGEPFMQLSREETIAAYVGKITGGHITDIDENTIKFMAETPVEEWVTLARALRRFAETIKKPDTE